MAAENIRNIVCPSCNNTYRMPEKKIPAKGGAATCKKCGGRIVIKGLQMSGSAFTREPAAAPKPSPASLTETAASPSDPALLEAYPELRRSPSP